MKFSCNMARHVDRVSSPARGTWVEIQLDSVGKVVVCVSSPARGTWVEMATLTPNPVNTGVVSRTGDVG